MQIALNDKRFVEQKFLVIVPRFELIIVCILSDLPHKFCASFTREKKLPLKNDCNNSITDYVNAREFTAGKSLIERANKPFHGPL